MKPFWLCCVMQLTEPTETTELTEQTPRRDVEIVAAILNLAATDGLVFSFLNVLKLQFLLERITNIPESGRIARGSCCHFSALTAAFGAQSCSRMKADALKVTAGRLR